MTSVERPPSVAPPLRTNSLLEGIAIFLVLTIVQRLIGFFRAIFFCRQLDPDQLGRWDLAYGVLVLAAPLAVFGLPGSFGRYVESYRLRGQLRTFLYRTTMGSLLLTVVFCITAAIAAPWIAENIFGSRAQTALVLIMSVSLAAFIAFNFLVCLFTALRLTRTVSYMQFSNSVLFAALSIVLLSAWEARSEAAVIAFGAACFFSCLVALTGVARLWRELPAAESSLPQSALWAKLIPFAFWLWLTNSLQNLLEIADRYMIVHYFGSTHGEGLALLGEYHSARILPVLFLGLADLLSTLITPHLAGDWERGRRDVVAARLKMTLKLFALGFVGISIAVEVASPLFFHTALCDKFAFGQAVLPGTLTCALWTGMTMISLNWLWCAEKSPLVCVGLAIGLATNVGLNLVLLPRFGLPGVVAASAAARLGSLVVLWLICRALGMRIDRGLIFVATLPVCLFWGPWTALAVMLTAAFSGIPGTSVFDAAERRQLATALESAIRRVRSLLVRQVDPTTTR